MALVVVAFAMTTLDTATRLTRFALTELADTHGVKLNRYVATAITVLAAAALSFTPYGRDATVMTF
ncbi:carbon starvation protein [Candidatus Methanophagaceae archaeon]|nr:carbon starvation protein [Methanophagales archaeon]